MTSSSKEALSIQMRMAPAPTSHRLRMESGRTASVQGKCESVKVLVTQSCPTLCDSMDCSPPGSSVHGILQARILQWVAIPSPGDLPNPGVKPWSSALQVDSLPSEPPGKPLCREVDTSRPMRQPPQGLDPKTKVPPCSPPGPRAQGEGLASLPLLLPPGAKARRPGVFQARVMSSGTILS